VRKKITKLVERGFEVDVIFPKGIVRVEDQELPLGNESHPAYCRASVSTASARLEGTPIADNRRSLAPLISRIARSNASWFACEGLW
jgi:hypothetical protein